MSPEELKAKIRLTAPQGNISCGAATRLAEDLVHLHVRIWESSLTNSESKSSCASWVVFSHVPFPSVRTGAFPPPGTVPGGRLGPPQDLSL